MPGAVAVSDARFGEGSGNIFLRGVQCTGSERYLKDCPASSIDDDLCTHAHDAGVRCQRGNVELMMVPPQILSSS